MGAIFSAQSDPFSFSLSFSFLSRAASHNNGRHPLDLIHQPLLRRQGAFEIRNPSAMFRLLIRQFRRQPFHLRLRQRLHPGRCRRRLALRLRRLRRLLQLLVLQLRRRFQLYGTRTVLRGFGFQSSDLVAQFLDLEILIGGGGAVGLSHSIRFFLPPFQKDLHLRYLLLQPHAFQSVLPRLLLGRCQLPSQVFEFLTRGFGLLRPAPQLLFLQSQRRF
mmetsp:Transcript_5749/g.10984  ORF Transcript_5749/g.10984 Transcript_5749/m.10984 type:complete len:218 (+) Transcript_5749:1282-1935(+)